MDISDRGGPALCPDITGLFSVYRVLATPFSMVNFLLDKSNRLCIIDPKSFQALPEQFLFFPIACRNEGLVFSSASSVTSAVQSANLVPQRAEVRRQKISGCPLC